MDDGPARRLCRVPGCARRRRFHGLRYVPAPGTRVGLSVVVRARRFHTIRRTASSAGRRRGRLRDSQTTCDVPGHQSKSERSLTRFFSISCGATESIAAGEGAGGVCGAQPIGVNSVLMSAPPEQTENLSDRYRCSHRRSRTLRPVSGL